MTTFTCACPAHAELMDDVHAERSVVHLAHGFGPAWPLSYTHPRLASAAQFVACLSNSETEAWLRALVAGQDWSGEAVNHFGGVKAVFRSARQYHRVR